MIMRISDRILSEKQFHQIGDWFVLGCKGRCFLRYDLHSVCLRILSIPRRSICLLDCICAFHQIDGVALSIGVQCQGACCRTVFVISGILSSFK